MKNSNEAQNFHVIIEAFLNMAVITKNLQVLRDLYRIIREHKTTFEGSLKNSLNIIVTQQINLLSPDEFQESASGFIKEFLDRNLDKNVDDNTRWAVASKIIFRILETCPQQRLADLFVLWNEAFLKSLKDPFENYEHDHIEFFNLVREKSHIMAFYEILYRRLPVSMIKGTLHHRLYLDDEAQNRLTKTLVEIAAEAKRAPVPKFASLCKDPEPVARNAASAIEGGAADSTAFGAILPEINS